jgi:hypothetical protein
VLISASACARAWQLTRKLVVVVVVVVVVGGGGGVFGETMLQVTGQSDPLFSLVRVGKGSGGNPNQTTSTP